MVNIFEEHFSKHDENRLNHEGDVVNSRKQYFKHKPNNLNYLLNKRYSWMNKYIRKNDKVLEIGSGGGFSREFIRKDVNLILTDVYKHEWIDEIQDAMNIKHKDKSFDVIFCSNMVHHVAYPKKFFKEMNRLLKPGGFLIIQEINASYMMRLIFYLLKHEGWSFKQNVFDETRPCNSPDDPWSANCAVPNLLFDDKKKFEKNIPYFKIIHHTYSEFLIFIASGGVTAKARTIQLPKIILKIVDFFDLMLITLFPNIFALQRRIVLVKR